MPVSRSGRRQLALGAEVPRRGGDVASLLRPRHRPLAERRPRPRLVRRPGGELRSTPRGASVTTRRLRGLCVDMRQSRAESAGLSTYEIVIVPVLWKLGQRRNSRLFQRMSVPDIVDALLDEHAIERRWELRREDYAPLELRTQYRESDLDFVSRLLEETGIAYSFEDEGEHASRLVLHDHPEARELRATGPLPFVDETAQALASGIPFVTRVELHEQARPGRVALRDYDFRRPSHVLGVERRAGKPDEAAYEQYGHAPGAALRDLPRSEVVPEPAADDLAAARWDDRHLDRRAQVSLEALRVPQRRVLFRTNVADLVPGSTFQIGGHPHGALLSTGLLVTHGVLSGEIPSSDPFLFEGEAVMRDQPYRPAQRTPRPVIHGAQSAVVTGPEGAEIHTDEHGRVRVLLTWDRVGTRDEHSSIWLRVSQGWAGAGYGFFALPRVGHEVLVSFFDGDPDCPYVSGRLHNAAEAVPHRLPQNQTVSTWKSCSSPHTGGFNEIRFEDAAGREMVYEQAERDRKRLVKNDERCAVGGHRARSVRRNEAIGVGGSRCKAVALDELEATGVTRTSVVGVNRQSFVGNEDNTVVGSKFSVTVARGAAARLARRLQGALQEGPLGAIFRGPASALLGMVPATALGAIGAATDEAIELLETLAPKALVELLGIEQGLPSKTGPADHLRGARSRDRALHGRGVDHPEGARHHPPREPEHRAPGDGRLRGARRGRGGDGRLQEGARPLAQRRPDRAGRQERAPQPAPDGGRPARGACRVDLPSEGRHVRRVRRGARARREDGRLDLPQARRAAEEPGARRGRPRARVRRSRERSMSQRWDDEDEAPAPPVEPRGSYADAFRKKLGLRPVDDEAVRFPAGEGRPWVGHGHYNADVVSIREFIILGRGEAMNAYEITDYAPAQGLVEGLLRDGGVTSRVSLVKKDARLFARARFDLEEGQSLGAITAALERRFKDGSLLDRAALRRSGFTVSISMFYRLWAAAGKPRITLFAFDGAAHHADMDLAMAANGYRSFHASGPIRGRGQVDGPFVSNPSPSACPECGAPMVEHRGSVVCQNQLKKLAMIESLDQGR
ncbi:MAG: type VI secretion system tip protein TssI/VgrG [Byssovorax sp.]